MELTPDLIKSLILAGRECADAFVAAEIVILLLERGKLDEDTICKTIPQRIGVDIEGVQATLSQLEDVVLLERDGKQWKFRGA